MSFQNCNCVLKRYIDLWKKFKKIFWLNIKIKKLLYLKAKINKLIKNYYIVHPYYPNYFKPSDHTWDHTSKQSLEKFNILFNIKGLNCKINYRNTGGIPLKELISLSIIIDEKISLLTRYKQLKI